MLPFHSITDILTNLNTFYRSKIRSALEKYKNEKSSELYNEIEDMRRKLDRELDAWFSGWYEHILEPVLLPMQSRHPNERWPTRSSEHPETTVLPLPSSLPACVRNPDHKSFVPFNETEQQLRRGQANDILHDIRSKIGLYSFIWKKTSGTFGQAAKTRNAKTISNTTAKISELRLQYEDVRLKLQVLGEAGDQYPPLTQRDCIPLDIEHGHEEPGMSKKTISWIWRDNTCGGNSSVWQAEGSSHLYIAQHVFPNPPIVLATRIEWFRSSARTTRWKEEKDILEEEMKRTQRFYLHGYLTWRERSKSEEKIGNAVSRGKAAFSAR